MSAANGGANRLPGGGVPCNWPAELSLEGLTDYEAECTLFRNHILFKNLKCTLQCFVRVEVRTTPPEKHFFVVTSARTNYSTNLEHSHDQHRVCMPSLIAHGRLPPDARTTCILQPQLARPARTHSRTAHATALILENLATMRSLAAMGSLGHVHASAFIFLLLYSNMAKYNPL